MESVNNVYSEAYCNALELIYGENMMSEGGKQAIDLMLKDIDIQHKKVLDFGSGLGGIAFYMAQLGATVTGVEINPELVKKSIARTPVALKDKVKFLLNEEYAHLPLLNDSVNIVFTTEVLLHLTNEQKLTLLQSFYRVLKSKGMLIIRDWLSMTDGVWGENVNKMLAIDKLPLYACSEKTYVTQLAQVGFTEIKVKNYSNIFMHFSQETIQRLKNPDVKAQFIQVFGTDMWEEQIRSYEYIVMAHKTGELINAVLVAKKQ